ncbi:MAG: cytidylate kinase-like family protein [Deltaproteobacteria bacterium]|nr:cytidylate kinase-like family protein [Deltaproteobacteria bacterium]
MAVLTISRQFGAGGWTLGKAVAEKLGYQFVSEGVIDDMAKEANVSPEWIKSVEKSAGDWLIRFTSRLVSSSFIERHIGDSKSDFDENRYVAFLGKIIRKIAEQGNVVILGRGSQFILKEDPKVIKILLVADLEDRIKFLENIWSVSRKEAEKTIQIREKRRDIFLKYFDERHANDSSLYHLILNTSKVSLEDAEEMIVWFVKHFEEKAPVA